MLARLSDLLELHVKDLDGRIAELAALRGELVRYREHIETRAGARAARSVKRKQA